MVWALLWSPSVSNAVKLADSMSVADNIKIFMFEDKPSNFAVGEEPLAVQVGKQGSFGIPTVETFSSSPCQISSNYQIFSRHHKK